MEYQDLKHLALEYEDSLSQVEKMLAEETNNSDFEFVNKAANHISLYQGKRLRPLLVVAVAKCYGPVTTRHICFAVVAELLHTATLLHDDVLDEADMRRHKKNVKSEWGNQTSVLLGDYLFARSFRILSQLENQSVFSLIAQTTQEICEGELLQTSYTWKTDMSQSLYKVIIQKKTAELFAASCMGSAILSGVPDEQVVTLGEYGRKIGMAFQVTDDILDLAGNSIHEGKTLGTDLKK
ncbi:MAG: polyprenyl synthetase family protein, partial [Chlamydiota bacterium]|nr:polyprenyl synthetase family protein [Chlamydiota bacterium]